MTTMSCALRRSAFSTFAALVLWGCHGADKIPTAPTDTGGLQFSAHPCSATATIALEPTQSVRVDCSNGGTTLTLAGAGASYLLVPEFPTNLVTAAWYPYSFATGTLTGASAALMNVTSSNTQRVVGALADKFNGAFRGDVSSSALTQSPWPAAPDGGRQRARVLTAQRAADRALQQRARASVAGGQLNWARTRTAAARMASSTSTLPAITAAPSVGSTRGFKVASSFSSNTYSTIGAKLAYAGNNTLLYVDTLAPSNGFTSDQLQSMGQYFDQVLYPIDTSTFGPASDIDGNGHVIIVMSPVVNADSPSSTCASNGYVAGFIDETDFQGSTNANSNQGEVFYSIVPDPTGRFSCAHTVADLIDAVPATFLHEVEHLINFAQHAIVHSGASGESWADEGLAIVAEEMGSRYYESRCPPPACRSDPAQLFPDSSQGFVAGFLFDSYQFALVPDTASLTLHDDSDDGFSWRGGEWLLMRWLGDQYGSAFFRQFEQGPSSAIQSIEQLTGQSFPTIMANFGLSLYTDSLPGLPRSAVPAVNRFASRNLRQMWARVYLTSGPSSSFPLQMPVRLFSVTSDTTTAVMSPGAMTFFRVDTPATSPTVSIRFAAPGGVALQGALKPQVAVFRLPSGQ